MNDQIHQYLDEELSGPQREEFEAHIATCAECQGELKAMGGAIQLLTKAEWVKAPAGFTENLMAQLNTMHPPKRNWRVPIMKYTGVAAAVLLVFGLGVSLTAPSKFALQADNTQGLVVADNKVIVPAGTEYNGDITIENGDVEVRGKVNGNVTALNGKVYRTAGADISGETEEVDQAMEKIVFYAKRVWNGLVQ
nr:zf-HC2 domain-containing protein [Tumebacillus amylolyticus]